MKTEKLTPRQVRRQIQAIHARDQEYFRANPRRGVYARRATAAEIQLAGHDPKQRHPLKGMRPVMLVCYLDTPPVRGAILRQFAVAPPHWFNSEAVLDVSEHVVLAAMDATHILMTRGGGTEIHAY